MPRTTIMIKDPQALSMIREIEAIQLSVPKKQAALQEAAQKEFTEFVKKVDADLKDNFERLRMALSLPELVSPQVTVNYLKLGVAFLDHGDDEDATNDNKGA